MKVLDRITQRINLVGNQCGYGNSELRLYKLFIWTTAILLLGTLVPSILTLVFFDWRSPESIASLVSVSVLAVFLGYGLKTGNYKIPVIFTVLFGVIAINGASIDQTYFLNNSSIWFTLVPLYSLLFLGMRKGALLTLIGTMILIIGLVVKIWRYPHILTFKEEFDVGLQVSNFLMMVGSCTLILLYFERGLRESNAALERQMWLNFETERLASLANMAGGIAHEINNPMAIIHATVKKSATLATQQTLSKKDLENCILEVQKQVNRIYDITRSMIKLSRKDRSNTASISPYETILMIQSISQNRLKERGIQLQLEIESLRDKTVAGSHTLLGQVIFNLLSNSEHAVAQNKTLRLIVIAGRIVDDRVEISIRDNGPGVSGDARLKLFDPFFTTKDIGEGLGLGLSLARKIVESELKGVLKWDQDFKDGALFIIELPLQISSLTV